MCLLFFFNIVLAEQWITIPDVVPEGHICWKQWLNLLRFGHWDHRTFTEHNIITNILHYLRLSWLKTLFLCLVALFVCSIHALTARWCWLSVNQYSGALLFVLCMFWNLWYCVNKQLLWWKTYLWLQDKTLVSSLFFYDS